jgi:hypothetical protein
MVWGIDAKPNGVVAMRLPRPLFTDRAWRNTQAAAKHGIGSVGGKTLFPPAWSIEKIKEAIVQVLEDKRSRVMREKSGQSPPSLYLRGTVDGVLMEVGISRNKVGTAFPTWSQYEPATVGQAYREWWSTHLRLYCTMGDILRWFPQVPELFTMNDMREIYLGGRPASFSEPEFRELQLLFDPVKLHEVQEWSKARGFHSIISELLQRDAVLREIEALSI